jgi:hypothetical protein
MGDEGSTMGYQLRGRVLEVCTCNVICPCWAAHDPDGGRCQGALAYRMDSGTVDGVDVSDLTIAMMADIPGNVTAGNWRVQMFVDENASDEQEKALLDVFTGKAGGPVADFAGLIGDVVAVQRVPIIFEVRGGEGRFQAGDVVSGEVESIEGATGKPMVMSDTAFSTIPGSPAYIGKSKSYKVDSEPLGISLDISGRNAIQGDFLFEHAA